VLVVVEVVEVVMVLGGEYFVGVVGCEWRMDFPCSSMLTNGSCVRSERKPFRLSSPSPTAPCWSVLFGKGDATLGLQALAIELPLLSVAASVTEPSTSTSTSTFTSTSTRCRWCANRSIERVITIDNANHLLGREAAKPCHSRLRRLIPLGLRSVRSNGASGDGERIASIISLSSGAWPCRFSV